MSVSHSIHCTDFNHMIAKGLSRVVSFINKGKAQCFFMGDFFNRAIVREYLYDSPELSISWSNNIGHSLNTYFIQQISFLTRGCAKHRSELRLGHTRVTRRQVAGTSRRDISPVEATNRGDMSPGHSPCWEHSRRQVVGTKFCPRDKISHGAYDGICPCNMSPRYAPAICRLVCLNFPPSYRLPDAWPRGEL